MSEQLLQESEPTSERKIEPEEVAKDMAEVVLFRVMNLESHSGVKSTDQYGNITYTPDNQQYPHQGDFAFSGPNAFDAAVTRAYPNYTGNVHMLQVAQEHVVEPHPEDMPGVMYVKNGAEVRARRIPQEIVDEHIARIQSKETPYTSQDIVQKMSEVDRK